VHRDAASIISAFVSEASNFRSAATKAIRFLIVALLEAPSFVKREIAATAGDTSGFVLLPRFMAAPQPG
jgi:hypothetical protein